MAIKSIIPVALVMLVLAGGCGRSVVAQTQSASIKAQRESVVAACESDGDSAGICACGFDKWAGDLPEPASPSAQAFVDMMLLPDDQRPEPATLSAAMTHMSSFSQALMDCANTGIEDQAAIAAGNGGEAGALGAPMASGDKEAGGAPDAQAEPVMMNGVDVSTKEKRYAWREREVAELDETGLRNTPVAAFEDVHKANCMAERDDAASCHCSWNALVTSLEGRDDVPARIAAYMSSVPPSDIPDVTVSERKAGGELFSDYLAVRKCN